MAASDKDQHEWAWEFHKQCDSLLHSRLSAYFIGQSFLVTGFVLMVANAGHFHWFSPYLIALVGLVTATMWLFVNVAMYRRLEALNQRYLMRMDASTKIGSEPPIDHGKATGMRDVFTFYSATALSIKSTWLPLPLRFYKYFIPYFTPIAFGVFWIVLSILHCVSTGGSGNPTG